MINKLKALIDTVRHKWHNLRLSKVQVEEHAAEPLAEDTILPEEPELSSLQNSPIEEESAEDIQQKPSLIHKGISWLKSLIKIKKEKQADLEAEDTDTEHTLVIPENKTLDVQFDIESDDQIGRESVGRLANFRQLISQGAKRKIVWIPAVLLALFSIGTPLTIMVLNKISAQNQELHNLQMEAKKLEQENLALKKSKNKATSTEAKPPLADATLPAVSRPQSKVASKANFQGGDCVVSDKTNVRESLKSCIEAFNASGN